MACVSQTLNGIALDCDNTGGLKALYLVDVVDVSGVTVASGEVTAISMVATKKFKAFSFRKGNANFASTGNRDDAAGTSYVETVTTAQFNKMETVKRADLVDLAMANSYVIAQDQNNKYWFIGYKSYNSSVTNGASGAAMADANAYTVTLTTQTKELPMEVQASVMATIV